MCGGQGLVNKNINCFAARGGEDGGGTFPGAEPGAEPVQGGGGGYGDWGSMGPSASLGFGAGAMAAGLAAARGVMSTNPGPPGRQWSFGAAAGVPGRPGVPGRQQTFGAAAGVPGFPGPAGRPQSFQVEHQQQQQQQHHNGYS